MRKPSTAARATILAGALTIVQAAGAGAQPPVSSFGDLATRLRPGDTVYVKDGENHEKRGILHELTPSGLVVRAGKSLVEFPADRVEAVRWQPRDPLSNGAVAGFAVGVGLGLTEAAVVCSDRYADCNAGIWAIGVMLYGGLGSAIGVGIDALIPGKKVAVYERPGASRGASVSVKPIVQRRRQGLAVSVGF